MSIKIILCYILQSVSHRMASVTRSVSFHRLYHQYCATKITQLFQEWNKHLPYIRPCYSISQASSPDVVSFLRKQCIPMICHDAREVKFVDDPSLVVMDGRRIGYHECIVRSMNTLKPLNYDDNTISSTPIWIHTTISNDGIDRTKEMFEYIWSNKYILNGIVFDIANFSHPTQSIPPSIYSYKVAIDYIFRNIVYPFEKEYGIMTPAIMIDGRHHITHMRHLYELNEFALSHVRANSIYTNKPPELRLIVGSLIDSTCIHRVNDISHREYP